MLERLESRVVQVDGDEIKVYTLPSHPNAYNSFAFQNQDTRTLDERFGLTGVPVTKDSAIGIDLQMATGSSSLGMQEVELTLRYFANVGRQTGNFVGLPEKEIRENIRNERLSDLTEAGIEISIDYKDRGVSYLKRIDVEGTSILFPANLRKKSL